jgi:hypothetical protein
VYTCCCERESPRKQQPTAKWDEQGGKQAGERHRSMSPHHHTAGVVYVWSQLCQRLELSCTWACFLGRLTLPTASCIKASTRAAGGGKRWQHRSTRPLCVQGLLVGPRTNAQVPRAVLHCPAVTGSDAQAGHTH